MVLTSKDCYFYKEKDTRRQQAHTPREDKADRGRGWNNAASIKTKNRAPKIAGNKQKLV